MPCSTASSTVLSTATQPAALNAANTCASEPSSAKFTISPGCLAWSITRRGISSNVSGEMSRLTAVPAANPAVAPRPDPDADPDADPAAAPDADAGKSLLAAFAPSGNFICTL